MNSMIKTLLQCFALVIALVFITVPEVGFAADQGTTSQTQANAPNWDQIKGSFDSTKLSDKSKRDLQYLFGDAGGLFGSGGSDSAVAYVLGTLNIVALAFGVIILAYVLTGGAINTASSGELIGRNWSSVWMPLRIVAAFGFVTPLVNTPYSSAQYLPLYAYVFGDNFATSVAKDLQNKILSRDVRLAGEVPTPPVSLIADMAGSVVCAANEYQSRTASKTIFTGDIPLYFLKVKDSNGLTSTKKMIVAPGADAYKVPADGSIVGIDFGSTGACGSFDLGYGGAIKALPLLGSTLDTSESAAAYKAANAVIMDYLNYFSALEAGVRSSDMNLVSIKMYYEAGNPTVEPKDIKLLKGLEAEVGAKVAAFPAALKQAVAGSFKARTVKDYPNNAIKHWTDTTLFMLKLSQYSAAPNMAMQTVIGSIKNPSWRGCFANSDNCNDSIIDKASGVFFEGKKVESTMPLLSVVAQALTSDAVKVPQEAIAQFSQDSLSGKIQPDKLMNKAAYALKTSFIQSINEFGAIVGGDNNEGVGQLTTDQYFAIEPMILLTNIGNAMLGLATLIFGALMTAGGLSYAAGGSVVTSTFGAAGLIGLFQAAIQVVSPLMWGVIMAGVSLSFIALIPVVVGIYAYLSLLIQAVQGVAMAPFATILLATPEGEGATTQTFQRFMLHVLTLLVTGTLIVLACYAGIMITKIGANMVIAIFVNGMNFFGSDSPWMIFGSVGVFIWLMFKIVITCSKFMLTWPDEILRALGGGFFNPMGGNSAEEVQGMSRNVNAATQAGLGTAVKGAEAFAKARNRKPAGEDAESKD